MSDELLNDAAETGRIEAFSDGVFAIAITLLVLDLKVPSPSAHGPGLAAILLRQWPSYLAFATSFAFIGIMWINHHRLFTLIRRSDHTLLLLNGLLLFGVTAVPFPTALLAAYIGHRDERVAAMVYSGTYVVIAIAFNLLWRYASYQNRLLDRRADPRAINAIHKAYAYGPLLYVIAFGLAILSVPASLGMNIALAIFFVLPTRHQLKLARPRR
jgi:TMEM175 potassium channel family protein